jgi:hypothetical protein
MSESHGVQVTLGLLGHVIRCHFAVWNAENNFSSGPQELHSRHIVLPALHGFLPEVVQLAPLNLIQILPNEGLHVKLNCLNDQCKPGRSAILLMAPDHGEE